MKREVLDELLELRRLERLGLADAHLQDHARLAAEVDVGGERARALELDLVAAADLDLLADLGDERLLLLGELALEVGLAVERRVGDLVDERLEVGAVADEVRLAVDLDDGDLRAARALLRVDEALLGGLLRALGGDGRAELAEELHGGVVVALGLQEGLLAFHHAHAGHLAELHHVGGGDVSHLGFLWLKRLVGFTSRASPRPWRPAP